MHIGHNELMIVDKDGFRLNVGIILLNNAGEVFLGRRKGFESWQFPQGGIDKDETESQAMYRELGEEIGLKETDVQLLGCTKQWYHYRLPKQFINFSGTPLVIGQKQKWFLLKLISSDDKINLDRATSPEFDRWRWVDYWTPPREVIYFKRKVYNQALTELQQLL
jgi:putative (di)nucleoside polyphosphate hydrolase